MKLSRLSLGVIVLFVPATLLCQLSLENIEKNIEKDHPITHVETSEIKEELSSPDSLNYILFDTREPQEYEKSHIQSAIQIDPEMSSQKFMEKYGGEIEGKNLVFYCSVGKRSSIFAERVMEDALKANTASLANLRGGIFRWYNNGYPVVNDRGETDEIHPYNSYWGQLVQKREK